MPLTFEPPLQLRITETKKKIHFMCMSIWPALMSYTMFMQCLQRPEKSMGSSRAGVLDGCEPGCGCWEVNLVLLKEQPLLLTAKPPLQPHHQRHLKMKFY